MKFTTDKTNVEVPVHISLRQLSDGSGVEILADGIDIAWISDDGDLCLVVVGHSEESQLKERGFQFDDGGAVMVWRPHP